MDISSKSMAHVIFFIVLSLLLLPASTHLESGQEGFISAVISKKGLDFAKDLLIDKAISSMIALQLPDIEKSVKIPVVGKVQITLSNFTICSVGIASSNVKTGDSGIVLLASGATANLSMNWRYSYKNWLVPVPITDKGGAFVQVQGMIVGLDTALKSLEGTLKLTVLDCGCYVEDISIQLNGGASWLYQGVVDAFQRKIGSSVEDAITKKIREGITKLDSLLQSLPKQIQVNSIAALNVTFVDHPVVSNSSIELEINGLFAGVNEMALFSNHQRKGPHGYGSCNDLLKMVEISLDENVFNSAASLYFNENYMQWVIVQMPEQSILNTAGWRYIFPQLYKQYPDDNMDLNVSVTSPPVIRIAGHDIDTTIYSDVVIDVIDSGEVIPVACISMVVSASCSAHVLGNNLAGRIRLVDFAASLKWSEIGPIHMYLAQTVMSTILKTILIPFLNLHLERGFRLPLPHGFTLRNAEILCLDSRVIVCSDVSFTKQHLLQQLPN